MARSFNALPQRKVLNVAVRAAVTAAIMAPGIGLAQETDDAATQLGTLQVTGTRIKQTDIETASPVTVLQREDIVALGITDVGSLIQRLPSMSGSPIGTTTNNGGNGNVEIDLRGMGVDRTVMLVNGKRTVDGGDYQTIPVAMIERVEILKDGGSAVYGADAVAGVVNIITRQDFQGLTFDAQNTDWFDTDGGAQNSVSMVGGKTFKGGNFVFGAEYVNQEEAYQSDTPWDFFQDSYYIYPEGCENQVAAPYDGTPTGGCYPIGSSRIPEGRLRFANQGTFMNPDGAGIVPYDGRTYNYAPVNYIQTPYQRTNMFGGASFDLTDDIVFNSEFRGNFRNSAQELAPQPYNSPTDPAYMGNFEGAAYSGISENNFYLRQAVDAYNAANAGAADFTPLAYEPVTDARRRMVETARRFTQDVTQFQAVFGLSGTFNEMDWDVYYNKGYRSRIDRDFGQFSGQRLANAMGPSADLNGDGTPECYGDVNDPSTLIPGCVSMNFFGGPYSLTQDMIDYVAVNLTDTYQTVQDEAGFSVTGSSFALPAGPLGWAAGYQYRGDSYEYSPDSAKTIDAVTGNTGAGTKGALYSNAVFGEAYIPLLDNGTQVLAAKASVRYDDYSRFDSETTWQLGLEAKANETLKARATLGTVFRAPTIEDLFGGQVDDFPTYSDPCIPPDGEPLPQGCEQTGVQLDNQVLSRVGGNPNLQPETGDTLTAGIVWAPEVAVGTLSATVDYWQIELEDGISSLGVQFILDDCYNNGNQASCALITRRADYSIAQILDTSLNVAKQTAHGVDTEFRYAFDIAMGRIETSLLWTHLLERTKTAFAGADEEDLSGRYTDPTAEDGGAYADDKINYSIKWSWNHLMVGYLGEFISSLDADTFCNCDSDGDPTNNTADGKYIQTIDSQLYHDLIASYEFPGELKLQAGITNVTNEAPPFIEVGFNATTDPSTYREFGRGYYLRLTKSFF